MLADLSQPYGRPTQARGEAAEPVRLKAIALPAEHGGWGMLGEPLLLGLLVAPSWAGLGVGIAAAFAFLARHPLKLAVADWRAGRRNPRTVVAGRLVLAYGGVALAGLALASGGASGWWLPMAAAAPLALLQLVHDLRSQGRQLLPELLGGVALGSVAASALWAAGWGPAPAFAAWALVALKAVGAVLYVRARLRCDRGLAFNRTSVLLAHGVAVAAACGLAVLQLAPWLAAAALAVLLARSAWGLSRFHRKVRPQRVGIVELVYGVLFIVLTAVGYHAGV
jgi:hypothetical protein